MPSTGSSRLLLSYTEMPKFIISLSPIIITFLLFLGGGGGLNALPALILVACFIISGVLMHFIQRSVSILQVKDIVILRNSMNVACGVFDIGNILYLPPIRVLFYCFTITYLWVHLGMAGLKDGEEIFPIIFVSILTLLSFADAVRLWAAKCFRADKGGNKWMPYLIALFVGLAFGGGFAALTTFLQNGMFHFFKKKKHMIKCDSDNKCTTLKLQNIA
jgi:hypothetical protein